MSRRRLKPSALCASLELHPPLSAKGQRWIPFPELSRKPVLGWLVTAGYTKKRADSTDASKLAPVVSALFFCALRAPRTAQPSGPADSLCGCARGETSGRSNALCGALHLIRLISFASFPSRGSLWGGRQPKAFPFEGKVGREAPRMRCSQPQLALPIPRRSAKPARFCRSKNGVTFAQVTKAAVRGAKLRERAKHAEKETRRKIGASLLAFVFSGFFFDMDCRDKGTSQLPNQNAGSLVLS